MKAFKLFETQYSSVTSFFSLLEPLKCSSSSSLHPPRSQGLMSRRSALRQRAAMTYTQIFTITISLAKDADTIFHLSAVQSRIALQELILTVTLSSLTQFQQVSSPINVSNSSYLPHRISLFLSPNITKTQPQLTVFTITLIAYR